MFKRLYAVGGVWYVLGGLGVFAICSMPVLFGLSYLGVPVPEILLEYSIVALLVGGAVCTVIFNSGNMQVVAQNRTTEMLERISLQLEERDVADRKGRRSTRRQITHKKVMEEASVLSERKHKTVVASTQEKTAHQEEYRCPVTKAVISVRD